MFYGVTILLLVPASLTCIYYWLLALRSFGWKRKRHGTKDSPAHTFAILIPAHNEEQSLPTVLGACTDLNYPREKYTACVVADNCTDGTAQTAIAMGALCLERNDIAHRGKGHALAWGFNRLLSEEFDAFLVLDADCILDPQSLLVFDQYLLRGKKVLQCRDISSNPDDNAVSYALALGCLIGNDLFYAPKSDIGLSVFLQGTGFVLHRDILEGIPFRAYSVAEDVEYTFTLLRHDYRVTFVKETAVSTAVPVYGKQVTVQRARWAAGIFAIAKRHVLRAFWEGLRDRKWILIDAGWTLLVLSKPLVFLQLFLAAAFAVLCHWHYQGPLSKLLLSIAVTLIVLQGSYVGLGILLLGITVHRLRLLLGLPLVFVRLLAVFLLSLVRLQKTPWARTPR